MSESSTQGREPPNGNNTYTLDPNDNTYKNENGDILPDTIKKEDIEKAYMDNFESTIEDVLNMELLLNNQYKSNSIFNTSSMVDSKLSIEDVLNMELLLY